MAAGSCVAACDVQDAGGLMQAASKAVRGQCSLHAAHSGFQCLLQGASILRMVHA